MREGNKRAIERKIILKRWKEEKNVRRYANINNTLEISAQRSLGRKKSSLSEKTLNFI
jgi:hypothetical protein